MDLTLSDEQRLLRESVDRFIAETYDVDHRRRVATDPLGFSPAIWKQFADLGWLALPRNRHSAPGSPDARHKSGQDELLVFYTPAAFASRIACQTFIGVSGVLSVLMPSSLSASITPLATQGGPPIAPDSPQPLAPSGLVRQGADSSSVT